MSEYKPNPSNPIFGVEGYHSGDTAEDLPGTALQREREEREKARAAREELRKQAAEEKKLSEQEEKSYINGDFQTLLGFGGNKVQAAKRLLSDAERTAASIPVPHPMEENAEYWATQSKITKPETAAKEVVIPESDPWAMSPAELEAQVERQVDTLPKNTLVRQVATAAPNLTPEQNKQVVEELQKPENKATIFKRMKDKIGAFAAGGTGGYASSMVARVFISTGIRSVFGTTLGVGIAAGAIAGGSVEGVKSYIKERNKFSADDIMNRLDNSKSEVERAVVISEANKALQEARISHPERVAVLTQKIQEAQVVLEAKIKSPEFKNESEKNKIAFILKTSETARDNINRDQKKEIKAFIKELKFKTEKSEVDWNKVMKSTGKGALVGALGGALGGLASGWIAEHLGQQGADGLTAIHAGHVGQAYSSAIENGREGALNGTYVEHVLAGDKGLTEEARKAVHDYLTNLHSLGAGQAPDLSTAQYIYAEDWLVKNAIDHGSTVLHPGDVINISGAGIQQALEHAQNLSQDQLANLTELISHQPHLISQHTADWLNNFDYANPENGQAVASLLQEAGNSVEYTINNPALMEAAAWASGALPEASYQMGREATHFIWHMAGKDADAEARGISETAKEKTAPQEKTETPSTVEANADILKLIDSYKDLKIKAPRNLEGTESASLGFMLLRILETDPEFSKSAYYATLKKTKFNVGFASTRNKEGVVARKTGLYMYIGNTQRFTAERRKALLDSLKEKLDATAKNEAASASPENPTEAAAERIEISPEVIGNKIKVRRPSGQVETDWLVLGVDSKNKTFKAAKIGADNETTLSTISFEDYQSLNKPEGQSAPGETANQDAGAAATEENVVDSLDMTWPNNISDQSRDSFKQELISIFEKIRAEHSELLPYMKNIKLNLIENRNNIQAANIKLNANGSYDINIMASQELIYDELLPVLEHLQRTANPV